MLEWEEGDRFSFEDSDRFEEDSLCSWSSEPESVCNNWRGWKRPILSSSNYFANRKGVDGVPSLTELAAKCVASHIPFELVEHVYPPVPEQLQLRIAYWSFPDNEEDIRLYSCLANGSADEFTRGESLYKSQMVKDPLQIGFHLSATVQQPPRGNHNVAVTFDRRKISSCNCTCNSTAYWCSHIVAVCLTRIHWPHIVTLRAPVSESLSRLHREQLQKFAQYLISELPQQILPTAQRLLDELLGSQPSAINSVCGAPDPTAGASANDQTSWYLDEKTLHDNIKKILIKFCVPAPIVFSDVNYLSTVAPPAAAEWTSLLRPLRGREPEGMWNLLSIVREMFKRNDRNAIPLLEIITNECIACDQILIWWFNTKVALLNGNSGYGGNNSGKHNVNSNTHASQHACSSLCDEVVALWRLAALNPGLAPGERDVLHNQFTTWHLKILEKVSKCRNSSGNSGSNKNSTMKLDLEVFTGFKPAIEACYLDWDDYPMPGITYSQDINPMYHCPFTCFRHAADGKSESVAQVNTSKAILNCEHPSLMTRGHHYHRHHHHHHHHHHFPRVNRYEYVSVINNMNPVVDYRHHQMNIRNGNRSSVSSEGFCENDDEVNIMQERQDPGRFNDSDSQEGGGSDTSSSSRSSSSSTSSSRSINTDVLTTMQPTPEADSKVAYQDKGNQAPETFKSSTPETFKSSVSIENKVTEVSRRPSKDESSSSLNSDSPQSDEYNLYYYDTKETVASTSTAAATSSTVTAASTSACGAATTSPKTYETDSNGYMFHNTRKCDDPWDVLFARAEGLHAHGHSKEACILGVKLAEELLANPPELMIEIPIMPKKKGKKQQVNPASHQLSCLASATLSKCAFLCSVLAENPEHFHLAFRIGMFGLEMARPPASTKPLEVKLANQESDLVNLLKKIPLGRDELNVIRERAKLLKEGTFKSRGDAMLPIMLASFIFDALLNPNVAGRDKLKTSFLREHSDELFGFEAAVAVLGMKANVSEAEHPLLCEGLRRQRGDLAIALLTNYKDDPVKISLIMNKLLDREVHQLSKSPIPSSSYSSCPPIKSHFANLKRDDCDVLAQLNSFAPPVEMYQPDMAGTSRPHSSTSAELEQGVGTLSIGLNGPSMQVPLQPRTKETKYKGKRIYPSLPNQPSEAGAHFMFELAKTVLNKAGGTSSTSLFTQPSTSQNHHGPHRALHMCAFQLGLYALGLHNCVSHNWLSRTYSSHVSWITGQAMEIGAHAISFLIDTWEGHLTPPEAASIADRASRGCDPNMVTSAAELALSCLPHAHALNPNEIQRAILQCKEQSDEMLEHACLTVENVAKGGGVYPEVLFQVAKHWYELYIRNTPGGEQLVEHEIQHEPIMESHGAFITLIEPNLEMQQLPPGMAVQGGPPIITNNVPVVVTTTPPMYQHPTVTTLASLPIPYTVGHYNFLHPHHTHHVSYGGPIHPHALPIHQPPAHMPMYQYQYPPSGNNQQYNTPPPPPSQPPYNMQQPQQNSIPIPPNPPPQYAIPPPPPSNYVPSQHTPPYAPLPQTPQNQMQPNNIQFYTTAVTIAQPSSNMRNNSIKTGHIYSLSLPSGNLSPPGMNTRPSLHRPQQFNQTQLRYLLTAYRVGMLAMETIARRVHDDRPQTKYSRNPPYGEDVKWLLRISKHLGTQYLHHFCCYAVKAIVSPYVLYDVAVEAAQYLARNNPGLVMQHLRTALNPIINKSQQMYLQCLHQKLYHLQPADYEEFISLVCAARAAFQVSPESSAQFKDWLQTIRRTKSFKKDLWTQINTALQTNTK